MYLSLLGQGRIDGRNVTLGKRCVTSEITDTDGLRYKSDNSCVQECIHEANLENNMS